MWFSPKQFHVLPIAHSATAVLKSEVNQAAATTRMQSQASPVDDVRRSITNSEYLVLDTGIMHHYLRPWAAACKVPSASPR